MNITNYGLNRFPRILNLFIFTFFITVNLHSTNKQTINYQNLKEVRLTTNLVKTTNKSGEITEKNILTQEMLSLSNTRYIIQYNYDLNGTEITIPKDCILDFQGGSFNNGTIIGINTSINANLFCIFGDRLLFRGTWKISCIFFDWFSIKKNDETFDNSKVLSQAIKFAILAECEVKITSGTYYFLNAIDIYGINTDNPTYLPINIVGDKRKHSKIKQVDKPDGGTRFIIGGDAFMTSSGSMTTIQGSVTDIKFTTTNEKRYIVPVFKNITLRQMLCERISCTYFFSFVSGRIINLSRILHCDFTYFKHLVYCEMNAEAITDSIIMDCYINGSIPYEYGETEMIHGYIQNTRITNNFIDFYKYIFYHNSKDEAVIKPSVIISNNIFDYCYRFNCGKVISLNFTTNIITACHWDYAKRTAYWNNYNGKDVQNTAWIFFYAEETFTSSVIINNTFRYGCYLFVSKYNANIKDLVIKNNMSSESTDYIWVNMPSTTSYKFDIEGYEMSSERLNLKTSYRFKTKYSIINDDPPITFVPIGNYYSIKQTNNYFGKPNLLKLKANQYYKTLAVESLEERLANYKGIYYVESKKTGYCTSCLYSDSKKLLKAGKIKTGTQVLIADLGIYMNSPSVEGNPIVTGLFFNSNFCNSNGFAHAFYLPSLPTNPFINQTVSVNNIIQRFNGSSWIALDSSNQLLFYFYPKFGVSIDKIPKSILNIGDCFFTNSNKPIWWNGSNWVDTNGIIVK